MAVNLHGSHFRFGSDDGTESSHTFKANVDTNPTHDWAWGVFLLRFTEQETGNTAASNTDATFEYKLNSGTWTAITTTSSVVKAVAVNAFTNGANCTKRLTGTGTFESSGAGCTEDGTSGGTANDIAALGNSETECGLQFVEADLANGDVVYFRFTSPDWTVTMDVAPAITIVKSVTTPQAVAGTFGMAGALGRQTSKALAGPLSAVGTLQPKTSKSLAGTAGALAGVLTTAVLLAQGLSGALGALAGTLALKALKGLGGVLSALGVVGRTVMPSALGGAFGMGGAAGLKIYVSLAGAMNFSGVGEGGQFFTLLGGALSSEGALTAKLLGSGGIPLTILLTQEQINAAARRRVFRRN